MAREAGARERRSRWRSALRIAGVFAVVVLLHAASLYAPLVHTDEAVSWRQALLGSIPMFGAWALVTPIVARLLRRYPLDQGLALRSGIGEEVDLCLAYLEIERIRRPGRLEVRVQVEPEARAARVPTLLLQPLAENAVRHGIAPLARGGTVTLKAARRGGRLAIEVRDDGVGLLPPLEASGPRRDPVWG